MVETIRSYLVQQIYINIRELREEGMEETIQSAENALQGVNVIDENFGYKLTIRSSIYHSSFLLECQFL